MFAAGNATRPPGPRGQGFVGNIRDYEHDRIEFVRQCERQYGSVFSFDSNTIVVSDPALVHDVLERTNKDFGTVDNLTGGPTRLPAGASPRIGSEATRDWMTVRRNGWRELARATQAHAGRLVGVLDATLGETAHGDVGVVEVARRFMLRSVAEFCLGADASGMPEMVVDMIGATLPFSTNSYLLPKWMAPRLYRRAAQAHTSVDARIAELARSRHKSINPAVAPHDFLDVLLHAQHPEFDAAQITLLVRALLLASYPGPSAGMAWIIRELAINAEARERLDAEATVWRDEADPPSLSALPYATALVKEVLRVHPPGWLLRRRVLVPTTLGAWTLAPGDQIMLCIYLIHHNNRLWPDPDRVNPDRWLDAGWRCPRNAYVPFSAGPRVCLGTQLGMLHLVLATSRIAQRFDVQSPGANECRRSFRGVLGPDEELRVTFRPRA